MSPAQPVNTSPESLTNVMQNLQPPGSEEHCAGTHLIVSNLLGMGMARFFLPLSDGVYHHERGDNCILVFCKLTILTNIFLLHYVRIKLIIIHKFCQL